MDKVKSAKKPLLLKGNWRETVSFLLLLIIMAFPLIDFLLRRVLEIPLLSSLWDELVLFTGILLALLQWRESKEYKPDFRINNAVLFYFLFGIAMLVLDLTSFSINLEGFRAIYQYILFFYVGFYLAKRYPQTKTLLSVAFVLGTLIGLYGIYQYLVGAPMPGRWVDSGEAVKTRAFSIVGSPNVLGSHMALLAPIGLGLIMNTRKWSYRAIWALCTGLILLCLLFTLSRGAWLALVGALGIMGIFYDKRVLAVGIVVAILSGIFVPAVNQRMGYLLSAEYMEKSSQSGRISRWLTAYDQMMLEPLTGVGLGHFGGAVAKRHYNSISVDNYYMGMLAETGILGLGLLIFLMFIILKKGFDAWKALVDPSQRYLAAGLLTGLLAIALHNGVENIFEVPYLSTYFWVMSGFLVALPDTQKGGPEREIQ